MVLLARSGQAAPTATGPAYPASYSRPDRSVLPERACSLKRPVCVHASARTPGSELLSALEALETADARIADVLGWPRPAIDGLLGGGPEFDLYLVESLDGAPHASRERRRSRPRNLVEMVATERDLPRPGRWDRASSFALLDRHVTGCAVPNLIARAYASAVGWGMDAAEGPGLREARAAYVAELVAPCGIVTSELIDAFQSHPERAVCDASSEAGPAAGAPFSWYTDTVLGSGIGAVPLALTAIGPQRTQQGSWRWTDEPDAFDALRSTLGARPSPRSLGDFLLEFAVARLFWGDRDDAMHGPAAAFAGSFGRVRFEWSIPFASLPRRLAPAAPIEPTGATYLWVDLQGAPPGARLAFQAQWEAPVLFHWALVRIGADGREASRVMVTPQQRSTSAERYVEALDGLAGIVVVGINAGDLSADEPFDPDPVPFEPHSYVITLSSE